MDDAMMSRLMQSYGAANNAANANRVREFGASNPDVLERRAMGMRGSGNEDNSDLLGPLLDKLMAQTDGVPPGRVEVGAPEVQQAMPTVQNATAPTRKSATAAPAMGPNMPMASGAVNPLDAPAAPGPQQQGGSFWNDILTALLGTTSVAGTAAMRSKGGGGGTPPNNTPPNAGKQKAQPRAIGNDGTAIPEEGRWDTRRGVSDVVDLNEKSLPAPNKKLPAPEDDGSAIQEQMRKRAADEAETDKLTKFGKKAQRALGRK